MLWNWSPEQIATHVARVGAFTISHGTIYRWIRTDCRRSGTLYKHLSLGRKRRKMGYRMKDLRGIPPGRRHMSERPPEVESRSRPGHWEGDTVVGSDRHHCILTLVERKSRFAIIRKMPSRTAASTTAAVLGALAEHGPKINDNHAGQRDGFRTHRRYMTRRDRRCTWRWSLPISIWSTLLAAFSGRLHRRTPPFLACRRRPRTFADMIARLSGPGRFELGYPSATSAQACQTAVHA